MTILNLLLACAFYCVFGLGGCSFLESDKESGVSDIQASRPDCKSCHDYPGQSGFHEYHLYTVASDTQFNGQISCVDCHYGAVAHQELKSSESRTHFVPDMSMDSGSTLRVGADEVEFLNEDFWDVQNWIQAHSKQKTFPRMKTGTLHNNGILDIHFAPNVSSSGDHAAYKNKTCSGVACHTRPNKEYKW